MARVKEKVKKAAEKVADAVDQALHPDAHPTQDPELDQKLDAPSEPDEKDPVMDKLPVAEAEALEEIGESIGLGSSSWQQDIENHPKFDKFKNKGEK